MGGTINMKIIQIIEITYDDCLCNFNDIIHYEQPSKFTINESLKIGDKLILTKSGWILKRGDD